MKNIITLTAIGSLLLLSLAATYIVSPLYVGGVIVGAIYTPEAISSLE
jgi:hypothetical protein